LSAGPSAAHTSALALRGLRCYERGTSVEDLSGEVIAVVTEHLPRKSSPLSALLFHRLDDAYSEVGEDATACGGGRSARFQVFMVGLATTPEVLAARRHWFVLPPSRLRLLDER
jgi:hypothetical protein